MSPDQPTRGALQAAHEALADFPAIVAMHEEQAERAEAEVVRLQAENEALKAEVARQRAMAMDRDDFLYRIGKISREYEATIEKPAF